ncbi:MAG: ATP-binding protein [Parvibaculaceae bacterium]
MIRIWERSIATQFICLMLLALLLSQAIAALVSWDERGNALREAYKGEFLGRAEAVARLLETTPPAIENDITRANNTLNTRYWVTAEKPGDPAQWRQAAWAQLTQPFSQSESALFIAKALQKDLRHDKTGASAVADSGWTDLKPGEWHFPRPAKFIRLDDGYGVGLAIELNRGTWLNTAFAKPAASGFWSSPTVLSFAVTALTLSIIMVLAARGITRPMRRLAVAAEALGRGEATEALPETGPQDIRHTAEAFNKMQERLKRFVADRTRMLAAIGHDLRTPITSLRLRAEFVGDAEVREKMLATIDEMQKMTEATLTFAREESAVEETRSVDLSALVQSLSDDLADMGHDVTFDNGLKISYRCRADALRRAIRNLIENAVRYGKRARVSIARAEDTIDIVIEDDGPGIPPELAEQVFVPFYRLEDSRNRETGGVGLGLSIARSIVRNHGGDIRLVNHANGLRAIITLPMIDARARLAAAA